MKRSIAFAAVIGFLSPAYAADPILPDPVIDPPSYVPMWTGFYAGGQLGWVKGPKTPTIPVTPGNPDDPDYDYCGEEFAWASASTTNTSAHAWASLCAAAAVATTPDTGTAAAVIDDWNERFYALEGVIDDAEDLHTVSGGRRNSLIGGVHVGYNHQFENNFVLGGVADVNFLNWDRRLGVSDGDHSIVARQSVDYLGTLRAKAGLAADRVLFYGTGGLAFGGVKDELLIDGATDSSDRDTRFGYVLGTGIDFLATDNLSVGAEYLYTDLSKKSDDLKFHSVFLKVSYHFK